MIQGSEQERPVVPRIYEDFGVVRRLENKDKR